jgi:ABC-type dipeptide/oligopeptide/nickel transport system permease component
MSQEDWWEENGTAVVVGVLAFFFFAPTAAFIATQKTSTIRSKLSSFILFIILFIPSYLSFLILFVCFSRLILPTFILDGPAYRLHKNLHNNRPGIAD